MAHYIVFENLLSDELYNDNILTLMLFLVDQGYTNLSLTPVVDNFFKILIDGNSTEEYNSLNEKIPLFLNQTEMGFRTVFSPEPGPIEPLLPKVNLVQILHDKCQQLANLLQKTEPAIKQLAGRMKMRMDCLPQSVINKTLVKSADSHYPGFERATFASIALNPSQYDSMNLEPEITKKIIAKKEKMLRDYYNLLIKLSCHEIQWPKGELAAERLITTYLLNNENRYIEQDHSYTREDVNIQLTLTRRLTYLPKTDKAQSLLSDIGLFNDLLSPHFPQEVTFDAHPTSSEYNAINIIYKQFSVPENWEENFKILIQIALYCSALDEDYQLSTLCFTRQASYSIKPKKQEASYHTILLKDTPAIPTLGSLQEKYKTKKEETRPTPSATFRRAAYEGCCADIRFLKTYAGVNIHERSSNGFSAVEWAYKNNHLKTIQTLKELGADTSNLYTLLDKYIDKETQTLPVKNIVLCRAAANGNNEDIQILVSSYEAQLDAKENGMTPLQLAELNNHGSTVDLLKSFSSKPKLTR